MCFTSLFIYLFTYLLGRIFFAQCNNILSAIHKIKYFLGPLYAFFWETSQINSELKHFYSDQIHKECLGLTYVSQKP